MRWKHALRTRPATPTQPTPGSEIEVPEPRGVPLKLGRRSTLTAAGSALLVVISVAVGFVLTGRGAGGTTATWANPGEVHVATTPEVTPTPTPTPAPTQPAGLTPVTVTTDFKGFYSWAVLDRRTGARFGSQNETTTKFSESMIKAWLAADFLNRSGTATPNQRRTDQLVRMIRESNDGAAESIWLANGGDASIRRLIQVCGLTDTRLYPAWWSQTWISARDAVRMGECIANGTAAGPQWTPWLLNEMRNIKGTTKQQPSGGRWGIIDALPADQQATLAIKNGWTLHSDNTWNVNCLAIHQDWILAVMTDYAGSRGLDYGAKLCASIATQVLRLGG